MANRAQAKAHLFKKIFLPILCYSIKQFDKQQNKRSSDYAIQRDLRWRTCVGSSVAFGIVLLFFVRVLLLLAKTNDSAVLVRGSTVLRKKWNNCYKVSLFAVSCEMFLFWSMIYWMLVELLFIKYVNFAYKGSTICKMFIYCCCWVFTIILSL